MTSGADLDALAVAVVDALNERSPQMLTALAAPGIVIRTARGPRRGHEAAADWVTKTYSHLHRRWEVERTRADGDAVLVIARVQYVWTESGELGDEAPAAIRMRFAGGLLAELELFDDPVEAERAFAAA